MKQKIKDLLFNFIFGPAVHNNFVCTTAMMYGLLLGAGHYKTSFLLMLILIATVAATKLFK